MEYVSCFLSAWFVTGRICVSVPVSWAGSCLLHVLLCHYTCECVGGWKWIGGGVCVGTSMCGRDVWWCVYYFLVPQLPFRSGWLHPFGNHTFQREQHVRNNDRELMTMLFPGGAASGHCVHRGSVYVQD